MAEVLGVAFKAQNAQWSIGHEIEAEKERRRASARHYWKYLGGGALLPARPHVELRQIANRS